MPQPVNPSAPSSPSSASKPHTNSAGGFVNPKAVIVILAAGGVLVSLAQTMIVPLIVELPSMFNTSAANASWIITVTLLAGAVSTPVTGRLADLYGKKLLLLIALGVFIVGSIVCAVSITAAPMIVGRGLQGIASGLIPLGISLLHDLLPRDQAGKAIALMSSSMGIGGALGLPLAAAVAQFANWRILFAAVAVAALGVGLFITWIIPGSHNPRTSARFDILGAVGLAVGLVSLLLGITKGTDWGWLSTPTLVSGFTAIIILSGWGAYQVRRRDPLINLRTAAIPAVLLTNLASILFGFTMYAMNLLIPPVMQLPVATGYGLGQSMVAMGLWVMPVGIGMMAVSSFGAMISRTRGPRTTLIIAGLVIATGYGAVTVVLATLGNRDPGSAETIEITWTLILLTVSSAIIGCGIGLAFGAMPAVIMAVVPTSETAAANGFNALMRSLGTTSAATVLGVMLAGLTHQVGGFQAPTLSAYLTGLVLTTGIALAASGFAAAIPRPKQRTRAF